jgi:uncharacterized membrane protein YcjF (UPF0283 family)
MVDATPDGGGQVDPAHHRQAEQRADETAKRLLEQGATTDAPAKPEDLQWLNERLQAQEIEHIDAYAKQEIGLRRMYARGLLIILGFQLLAADAVFWIYADVGKNWNLSDGVIQIWLAATVVQVVGVVTVVTRHLFPRRDSRSNTPALVKPPSS